MTDTERLARLEQKVNTLEATLRRVLRTITHPATVMYLKNKLETSNENKDTASKD